MILHFEPVFPENRKDMEALQLYPEQSGFIESVAECLAVLALLEKLRKDMISRRYT